MTDQSDTLIFGIHAVTRALTSGSAGIEKIFLLKGRNDGAIERLSQSARDQGVHVEMVARDRLQELAGDVRHQGVIAIVDTLPTLDNQGLADLLDGIEQPLLLALDGVQDPHNLGACLRSAEAAGVNAIIVPRDRAVGITGVVRKVASGAAEAVPVAQVANMARTLRMLAEKNVWRFGAAAGQGTDLYAMDLRGPVCLVLGGEAQGLRRLTREHCDQLFHIPMQGEVESLNVSVAAGICLFEALRQRRHAAP